MQNQRVLSGDLRFLSLAEVMQMLNSNGSTGVLRLKSDQNNEPGVIYFSKGNLVNAKAGPKTGLDAAYALFGWLDGEFDFTSGEVRTQKLINQGVMEVVLDGLRMLDDGEVQKLGTGRLDQEDEKADGQDFQDGLPVIRRTVTNYGYVVDEEEFPGGSTIVREGKHGSWVCIILEGFADVHRETAKGPIPVVRLGPGSLVGNISSLLSQKSIRTATVTAVQDVVLGVLDLQRIHSEFAVMSQDMRQIAIGLDTRLREVTDRVVECRTNTLDPKAFMKDMKLLFDQGADEPNIYQIVEGRAVVVRKTKTGLVPLVTLKKGGTLGNLPFVNIGHEPMSAAIHVSPDYEAVPMDMEALQQEYEDVSTMVKGIVEHVAHSISVTTKLVTGHVNKTWGK